MNREWAWIGLAVAALILLPLALAWVRGRRNR